MSSELGRAPGSSSAPGRLIILSGPSASGKSTLWRHLVAFPQVTFSISATTRAARPGEVDGRDYHFLSEEDFLQRMAKGDFLEHAQVHGNRYGTLRSEVEQALQSGSDIVLEIDVQGAKQVRLSNLPIVSVFLLPPSMEILEQRLRDRKSETEEQVQRRLAIAAAEMAHAGEYDFQVVNHDLQDMIQQVEKFLGLDSSAPAKS